MTLENLELGSVEPYITIPKAAELLGIPVSTLRRAVNAGQIESYSAFNERKRVLRSEVQAAVASYKTGGQDNG